MTYDNTDTNADGAIEVPVDNDSVSTGKELHKQHIALEDSTGEKFYPASEYGSIQDAWRAAFVDSSDESVISIPPGIHDLNIDPDEDRRGLTIRGAGKQSTLIDGKTEDAISINSDLSYRMEVRDMSARTTPGEGNTVHGVHVYGSSANVHLTNLRVTESDADAYHLVSPEIEVLGCSHSAAGDIDDRGIYANDNLLNWMGGAVRTGQGVSNRAVLEFGPDCDQSTIRVDAGRDPTVQVDSDSYLYLDLGAASKVDLTFGSNSGPCRVDAMRYESSVNNGNASNSAYQRFDDTFVV